MSQQREQAIVSFSEVREAFDFVSFGPPMEHSAYLDHETGAMYWQSDSADIFDELPDDIDESDRYLAIPHKKDIGLGKPLALEFASDYMPDVMDKVQDIFSRSGAYARFKDLLENREMLKQWRAYEDNRSESALRQWCDEQGVKVEN